MTELKKNTMNLFKNISGLEKVKRSGSASKLSNVRKCFSVGTMVIKSLLTDINEHELS